MGIYDLRFTIYECKGRLATCNYLYDFQAVSGFELAVGKFRRGYGFAIMLDYDASRQKILRD
jgi:hypothetical protein